MEHRYQYQKFTSPRQLRLLKVHAKLREAEQEQPAEVRRPSVSEYTFDLITNTLDEAPSYETVSYVWGDGDFNAQLHFLDDGKLHITYGLYESLGELARECSTGFLWIDQICT